MNDKTALLIVFCLIALFVGSVVCRFIEDGKKAPRIASLPARSKRIQAGLAVLLVCLGLHAYTKDGLFSSMFHAPIHALTELFSPGGAVLTHVKLNEPITIAPSTNAVFQTDWRLHGAHNQGFFLSPSNWIGRFGYQNVTNLFVTSYGKVFPMLPQLHSNIFWSPLWTSLGIVPEAKWSSIERESYFCHEVTSNGSLCLTWKDVFLERMTQAPVSFQAELFPSGDFIFRYDFSEAMPSNYWVGYQNETQGGAWTNTTEASTAELFWRGYSGVELDSSDADGDGISNYDEVVLYGTDPNLADSDGDGINDYYDIHPNLCDANQDGVPDGIELAAWEANPYRAENAGFTNLTLTVVQGMSRNTMPQLRLLRLAPPPVSPQSALLDIGGHKLPLFTGDTIRLGLPQGEEIPASLWIRGNLPVQLQLSPGSTVQPFFVNDPHGIFSKPMFVSASGSLAFPKLTVELEGSEGECLHAEDTGRAFHVTLEPFEWSQKMEFASIEGFQVRPDGSLWLNGPLPKTPSGRATGIVTLGSTFLAWGTLSSTNSVHWCAGHGSYCYACGRVHTEEDACSHVETCAARSSLTSDCTCPPMFLRVNAPAFYGNESFTPFFPVGDDTCCCHAWTFATPKFRVNGHDSRLRLYDSQGNDLVTQNDQYDSEVILEATSPSETVGSGWLSYDVLDVNGDVYRTFTNSFTMGNVQLQPDWNNDQSIDEYDFLDQRNDFYGDKVWYLSTQTGFHNLILQNRSPSDAFLTLSAVGEGPTPRFYSGGTEGLYSGEARTNTPPFIVKNSPVSVWVDASGPEGHSTLTYSLSDTSNHELVSSFLEIQTVNTHPGHRVVKRDSGNVTWDYSKAPTKTDLQLLDPSTMNEMYVSWEYEPSIPSTFPPATYPVLATVPGVWSDGIPLTVSTGSLEIVEMEIAPREANTLIGCLLPTEFALTNSSVSATWSIQPVLEGGARLYSSFSLSGNGGETISSRSNIWVSPGTIVTNYTIRAQYGSHTNIVDEAILHVGEVRLVPDYNFDDVIDEEDIADASTNRVFRFWINNDSDRDNDAEPGWEVIFDENDADYKDDFVSSNRDRLDWFPLWLDIAKLVEQFPIEENYRYRFSQADAAVSFLWSSLTPATAGSFQKEDVLCFGSDFSHSMTNAFADQVLINWVSIPTNFVSRALQGSCVCLVEGCKWSQSPLVLEVTKNTKVIFRKEIPLFITPTTSMFRILNLRPCLGGSIYPLMSTNTPPNRPYVPNGKNVFFIHGFRVDNDDSLGWGSEFFKKLLRSGSRADFWLVTWEGDPLNKINYYLAVQNAFLTAPYLTQCLQTFPGEKMILAHSLGNMVASSAIADYNAPVSKYFALNAAVASEAYDATLFNTATNNPLVHSEWIEYRTESWSACWYQLFPSSDDRSKLTWRDRFAEVAIKTQLYNYYSSGDEVLEIGQQGICLLDNVIDWEFGRNSWHKQETFKGRNRIYGTGVGGWGFESNVTATAVANVPLSILRDTPIFEEGPSGMNSAEITDDKQNEILGYAIPSLSEPLGRVGLEVMIATENRDMNDYKRNGWCRDDDIYRKNWLHSDIQNTAFYYTYQIYHTIVNDGGLR